MSFRSKLRADSAVLQNTGVKVLKYSDGEMLTEFGHFDRYGRFIHFK